MGLNVKELLLGIPVLVFVLWVFSAPIPQQRIERFCQPINWVGNVATSSTALTSEGHTETAVRWNDKLTYSCKYMVWRLFYQEAYNQAVKEGRVVPVNSAPPTNPESAVAPKDDKSSAETQGSTPESGTAPAADAPATPDNASK